MRKRETHESGADGGHGAALAGDQGDGGMIALLRLMHAQQEQQQKWLQGQQEEQDRRQEEQEHRREEQERRREDLERQCEEQERGQAEQREMLRVQMDALRSLLERTLTPGGGVSTGGARSGDPAEHIKLTRLTEADDVEAYLTTFERLMQLGRIAEESWTLWLAPQLTGKAQQAYAALSATDATDYRKVKEAIPCPGHLLLLVLRLQLGHILIRRRV